ncbi:hypothetical protein AB833_22940 [Chromatiales bacterium (ex Bugula neritina AB1)]|nr:hypothetical protein AB833_22940 [Chromatiales bacterium (ex Bugula neritina AB1)]
MDNGLSNSLNRLILPPALRDQAQSPSLRSQAGTGESALQSALTNLADKTDSRNSRDANRQSTASANSSDLATARERSAGSQSNGLFDSRVRLFNRTENSISRQSGQASRNSNSGTSVSASVNIRLTGNTARGTPLTTTITTRGPGAQAGVRQNAAAQLATRAEAGAVQQSASAHAGISAHIASAKHSASHLIARGLIELQALTRQGLQQSNAASRIHLANLNSACQQSNCQTLSVADANRLLFRNMMQSQMIAAMTGNHAAQKTVMVKAEQVSIHNSPSNSLTGSRLVEISASFKPATAASNQLSGNTGNPAASAKRNIINSIANTALPSETTQPTATMAPMAAPSVAITEMAAQSVTAIGPGVSYLYKKVDNNRRYPGTMPNNPAGNPGFMQSLKKRVSRFQSKALAAGKGIVNIANSLKNAPAKLLSSFKALGSIPQLANRASLHFQLRKATNTDGNGLLSRLIKLFLSVQTAITTKRDRRDSPLDTSGKAIA